MKPHIRLHVSQWNSGDYYAVIFSNRSKTKILGATTTLSLRGVMYQLSKFLEFNR